MFSESERYQNILSRLVIKRIALEKTWVKVDHETPIQVIESMQFETKVYDVMLTRMVARGRLISPEMEEVAHRSLVMCKVLLDMEKEAYAVPAEEEIT